MATNALDIIERRESGGRNIYQQLVPRSVSSASGHFQMIKPTWQRWAKAVGVDINQYPEAINAPYELQRKVAAYGFQKEGFKPWEATKNLVGQEANYAVDGSTGAAYGPQPGAGGIPGGVTPSDLPPEGVVTAPGAAAAPGVTIAGWDPKSYAGVNPRMMQIVEQALKDNPGLFGIGHQGGRRDIEEQKKLLAKGVTKTLNSYHVHGNAIDLWPVNPATGKPDPNYLAGYPAIKAAMNAAAAKLGVTNLQTGQDWKNAWDKPHWELKGEQPYAVAGSTGGAYPSVPAPQPGAGGVPGGYRPSDLPPGGILTSAGTAPAPIAAAPPAPAPAPTAPYSAAPNSDAARLLSDPTRYGLSADQAAQMRVQMAAGGPGGGTIGNIPAPTPAPTPQTPAVPPPPGILPPAEPEQQGSAMQLFDDWKNRRPLGLFAGGWT